MPGVLTARQVREGSGGGGSGTRTYTYDLSGLLGGASNADTLAAGSSTLIIDGNEKLSGIQNFGAHPNFGSLDESDNMPVNRTIPVVSHEGTQYEALHPETFPIIRRVESKTGNYSGATTGSEASWKWVAHAVRMGTRSTMHGYSVAAANAGWGMLNGMYCVINETQFYNAPYFINGGNGSGSPWSHEEFYQGLGRTHSGGNPTTNTNDGLFYPGFFYPSVMQVTTNSISAMTSGTQTRTINMANTSGFHQYEAALIFDRKAANTPFKDEARFDNGTPFVNGEVFIVTAVNSGSITVRQFRMGSSKTGNNPTGKLFGTLASGGGSVDHGANSHIMPIIPGQGSFKGANWLFNNHKDGPVDASGRNYTECHVQWMQDHRGRTAGGGSTSIQFDWAEFDVTEDLPNGSHHFDGDGSSLPGSGTGDFCIVNNKNLFREARDYSMAYFSQVTGLKVGGAGIKDTFHMPYDIGGTLYGGDFHGVENIATGEFINSEDCSFIHGSSQLYRALKFGQQFAKYPYLCHVVNKTLTARYPWNGSGGSNATDNDVVHTKLALATICQIPFAPINYDNAVDNWWEMFAVEKTGGNAGKGIANTTGNQSSIRGNLGWMGRPIGKVKNMSGIDFGLLTPRADFDFENSGTSTQGFGVKSGSATTITKRASQQFLSIENISQNQNYGNSHVMTPADVVTSADDNKIHMAKVKISSSKRNKVRIIQGNSGIDRNLKETWIDEEPMVIWLRYTPNSGDTSSDIRRRISIQESRNEGDLRIHYVRSYVGTGANYNPLTFGQDFENGLAIANLNQVAVDVQLNDTYKVIDMRADEQCSWLTSGATVSGTFNIPAEKAVLLYRDTAPTIQSEVAALFDGLTEVSSTSVNGGSVSVVVPDSVTCGDFKLYPHGTIAPSLAA